MIEGGAVLVVFFISLLIYVLSRVAAGTRTPAEEESQLTENIARLEKSLALAEQKSWDPAMRSGISGQLADARRAHAELNQIHAADLAATAQKNRPASVPVPAAR